MRPRRRSEKGSLTVLTALIAVSSLLMVGLVLDLGEVRTDRRKLKGITDTAATAGVGRLAFGPWSGVCKARDYLLANAKEFTSFDAASETWSRASGVVIGGNPCPAVAFAADTVACAPNNPATWAKLQATAGNGRFTVEIQAGYALPDARFPNDAGLGDPGVAELGGCDNLAVILTERQAPSFAQVGGAKATNVRVRSVGRLNAAETLDFVAALQLLDLHNCDVLVTGGTGVKVIAQAYNAYPGTIQIDSDGTGDCNSNDRILNGQVTPTGGTIVACSADENRFGCVPGTGDRPSRIGIYAVNFKPASTVTSPYAATGDTSYGDTMAVPSPRTGRKYVDLRYRSNLIALDQTVKSMVGGTNPYPPGCLSISVSAGMGVCVGTGGIQWLVVEDCGSLVQTALNLDLTKRATPNIWFRCDLDVTTPLTLSGAGASIVVTGSLAVNSTFTITDPRKVYVGGRDSGNKIGLDLTGSGTLNLNTGGAATCSARTGPGHANVLVLGKGSLKVGSGFTVHLCQTFTYLASGYDKVPSSDGTVPCLTTTCANYTGTITVSSGASIDMSAPNEITGRLPSAAELANTNPFEDLGLWTEAGGDTNGLAGKATTSLTGVFFLPNADAFNLTGGGEVPIRLSAQFVSTSLKVSGNATINLVPNPEDSIPVTIYTILLVR